MAREKGTRIGEKSREPFKIGQYNNPLEGIKDKKEKQTKKWMKTRKA